MKQTTLDLLSDRETQIVDLAIDGMTDQQIGLQLEITSSTVNSYWVRIRGKLGHVSRTELVSQVVQLRANQKSRSLTSRIDLLENELAEAKRSGLNYDHANLFRDALDANPEACVVFDAQGIVVYANPRFHELFEFDEDCATGCKFQDLFQTTNSQAVSLTLGGVTDRARLGLEHQLFGLRTRSRPIRVFLLIGVCERNRRSTYSCVVRPFHDELETAQNKVSLVMTTGEMSA